MTETIEFLKTAALCVLIPIAIVFAFGALVELAKAARRWIK